MALMMATALGASFVLIYSAVRHQALVDLDRSLRVAESVWKTFSQARADNLTTTVSGLANEAGFLTVLRNTDQATVVDYLQEVRRHNTSLDLIWVFDDQGNLLAGTEASGKGPLDSLTRRALDGEMVSAFWQGPKGLYLAAAAPILRRGDILEGALLVAWLLDQPFVDQLSQDTSTGVSLLAPQENDFFSDPKLKDLRAGLWTGGSGITSHPSGVQILVRDLSDAQGKQLGRLALSRDLQSALVFLNRVALQLAILAACALGAALLLSIPLLKRITHSVDLLERAQADLESLFQANSDGLIALDREGRILSANRAAGLCLGREAGFLVGQSLSGLLPTEVFSELVTAPPSAGQLVQRSQWQRAGHTFELSRTFLAETKGEVASLLVTRDSSLEAQNRASTQDFLVSLTPLLQQVREQPGPAQRLRLEMELGNLLSAAGVPLVPEDSPARKLGDEIGQLIGEFSVLFPHIEFAQRGEAWLHQFPRPYLRLLLLNLLEQGPLRVEWEGRQGGSWLMVHLNPSGESLALTCSANIVQSFGGNLIVGEDGIRVWLPT